MFRHKIKKLLKKGQQGQSLVEFSLTAIILITILSGLLDLGRIYYAYVALEDAAGEAALYLAVIDPNCEYDTGGACAGTRNAEWRALHATEGILNRNNITVIADVPIKNTGAQVYVTVEYPYRFLTPIISAIRSEITLTGYATQTIVNKPITAAP